MIQFSWLWPVFFVVVVVVIEGRGRTWQFESGSKCTYRAGTMHWFIKKNNKYFQCLSIFAFNWLTIMFHLLFSNINQVRKGNYPPPLSLSLFPKKKLIRIKIEMDTLSRPWFLLRLNASSTVMFIISTIISAFSFVRQQPQKKNKQKQTNKKK